MRVFAVCFAVSIIVFWNQLALGETFCHPVYNGTECARIVIPAKGPVTVVAPERFCSAVVAPERRCNESPVAPKRMCSKEISHGSQIPMGCDSYFPKTNRSRSH